MSLRARLMLVAPLALPAWTGGCTKPGITNAGGAADAGVGATGGGDSRGGAGPRDGSPGAADFSFQPRDGADGAAGSSGGNNPTPGSSETNCGLQRHKLTRVPPEILLVLDRSATMAQEVQGSPNSRWTEVSRAVDEVVSGTQQNVLWGLKMFPTVSACDVTPAMEVAVGLANHPMMAGAMNATSPNTGPSGTPMQLAVRMATAHLRARTGGNPRFMLLATDGLPNCGPGPGIGGGMDTPGTVQAIREAAASGIRTYVVGIATHAEGAFAQYSLDMMADAGGTARNATPGFYPVNNQADLTRTFNEITGQVQSCVFPLDAAPPSPMDVAVDLDARRIPRDTTHTNGWDYTANMTAIEVYGQPCNDLELGKVTNVQIIYGCKNEVIP
jgi:hypothetical protein